ncbi:hypothetical protein GMA3_81 [Gordonia phage GMA3]|uniref:Uncharacterized protein n=1 Tax=Gordonia phage GMA3 TaxID=1647284 RepID=A0A0K0NL05_9CAUD|nr:DNA binding protein [Gordonia phage GMA3]AKL88258.1 hypothetical protein GMA3_81 [Gordonia phage GMA3]
MANKDGIMRVMVCVTVEVDRSEWMDRYGDHIVKHQLVPEVTLEKSVRKAAREGLAKLEIPSLAVDKPYDTKAKIDKGLHS